MSDFFDGYVQGGVYMDLLLNDILHLSKEEINNSKIEFNMQAGSG